MDRKKRYYILTESTWQGYDSYEEILNDWRHSTKEERENTEIMFISDCTIQRYYKNMQELGLILSIKGWDVLKESKDD